MNKRTFLKATVAAATAGAALPAAAAGADANRTDVGYFELRAISLRPGKESLLDGYLKSAFIPAVTRAGCGPVGVFHERSEEGQALVHLLIVHPSPGHFAALSQRLATDAAYLESGRDYLGASAADPVYDRIESSLYRGIQSLPKLQPTDPSTPRLLNLRIYESHNERAAAKKIEMFDQGELAIFQRVGLTPVFFGEALAGSRLPNLTYMLVFNDEEARKAAWDRFRSDPEWLKLKAVPEYADKEIVSKITNKILTPAAYSQI